MKGLTFTDEQCPKRGPGLTHRSQSASSSTCDTCSATLTPAANRQKVLQRRLAAFIEAKVAELLENGYPPEDRYDPQAEAAEAEAEQRSNPNSAP